jgi:hypothetical protein
LGHQPCDTSLQETNCRGGAPVCEGPELSEPSSPA